MMMTLCLRMNILSDNIFNTLKTFGDDLFQPISRRHRTSIPTTLQIFFEKHVLSLTHCQRFLSLMNYNSYFIIHVMNIYRAL